MLFFLLLFSEAKIRRRSPPQRIRLLFIFFFSVFDKIQESGSEGKFYWFGFVSYTNIFVFVCLASLPAEAVTSVLKV